MAVSWFPGRSCVYHLLSHARAPLLSVLTAYSALFVLVALRSVVSLRVLSTPHTPFRIVFLPCMPLALLLSRCTNIFSSTFEPKTVHPLKNVCASTSPALLASATICLAGGASAEQKQPVRQDRHGGLRLGPYTGQLLRKLPKAEALLRAAVLIFLVGTARSACAQQKYLENGFRPITPSVYSFFKYTDNPVNQYNGVPNIAIPIHTFKLEDKEFPFAFSYHAGGIRVDEEASWVGLGWDLSIPAVVQTINDEDDFGINTNAYPGITTRLRPDYPDYSNSYPLDPNVIPTANGSSTWSNPYPASGIPPVEASIAYTIATDYTFPLNGYFTRRPEMFGTGYSINDSEPDIIKVSLFSETLTLVRVFGTGLFDVLDHKGYLVSKATVGTLTTDGDGWIITDPEGYQYAFKKKQVGYTKANENSVFGAGGNNIATPSTITWYLTRVTSPRGRELNVVYNVMSADHVCNRHSEKFQTLTIDQQQSYTTSTDHRADAPLPGATYTSSGGVPGIFATDVEVRERRVYPSYISAPDASLTFEATTARQDANNSPQLDAIQVASLQSGGQKRLVLQHRYFQGTGPGTTYQPLLPNGDNAQYRLQLTGIVEENVGQYTFAYDAEPLPSRNSYAQDYWGYYNGCTTNTTLVPNSTGLVGGNNLPQPNNISTSHHGARLRYARAGILTGITYPTWGSTRYEYELNTFSNYAYWVPDYDGTVSPSSTGNGLRIKAIRSYAGNGQLALAESYEYSGGKALSPLAFIRVCDYTTFVPSGNGGVSTETLRKIGVINCSGQYSPAPTGAGTGVGYSAVTHRRVGTQAGTTITYYTNNPDITRWSDHGFGVIGHLQTISLPAYPDPTLRKSGATDSVVQFDSNGRRVSKRAYTYVSANQNSTIHYGARTLGSGEYYQRVCLSGCYWNTFSRNWIGFYPIFGKKLLKSTETVVNYSSTGEAPFATTVSYTYDNLDRVVGVAKRGKLLAEYSTFAYPVLVYFGPRNTQEQELCNQNRLQEVMAYSYWRGPITGTIASPPSKPLYRYTKHYLSHATGPVVDQVAIEESTDGSTSKGYSYAYDAFDILGRAQRVYRSSGPVTTYFWHSERPELLAEVKNNASGIAAYTSFEGSAYGNWNYSTTSFWGGGVTGRTHHELAQQQVQSLSLVPAMYTVSYWAKNGIPTCQVANGTANDRLSVRTLTSRADGWTQYQATATIATNGAQILFPAGQTGVWLDELRLHPVGAQLTSFVTEPLRGVISMADLNSRPSSYEYDAGNRLQRMRDEQQRILLQYQYQFARP